MSGRSSAAAAKRWGFADVVRSAREAKGLTQPALARKLNVSVITISRWERGQTRPRAFLLAALAEALGIPEAQLLATSAYAGDGPSPGSVISLDETRPEPGDGDDLATAFLAAVVQGIARGDAAGPGFNQTVANTAAALGVPWPEQHTTP